MSDENTPKPNADAGAGSQGGQDGGNGGGNPTKSFDQEEVNKIVSERLERAQKAFEKSFQERLEKERAEAERLAQLSAEEKEKEMLSKQATQLESQKRELTLRENKITAYEKLAELKLPVKFVDFVLSEDQEVMTARIETFHKEFTAAVESAVKEQFKGETPKANDGRSTNSPEVKTVF